jgi:nucleotide-binding universal stress UspA family protein
MSIFDRVIVGVDGTDFGFEALHQALVLCPADGAVSAVTALDTAIAVHAGFDMSRVATELEQEAERARAQAASILDGRSGCTATVVRGDAKSVLRSSCAKHDATLLALGGRSSSRFLGIMAGETAATLLHEAAVSVLLARMQPGQRWQPRRIVVGIDGSAPSLRALAVADDIAGRLGSILRVESATGGKTVDRQGDWTSRVDAWDPGHPVVALLDRSLSADLLIVGSRGIHGVRALGSVSERVAHRAICSTLVVHSPHDDPVRAEAQ